MAADSLQLDIKKATALSQDIRKCHQKLKSDMDNAKATVEKLKAMWTGDSASAFQTEFLSMYQKCEEALVDADKIATSLDEVVATYQNSQKQMEQLAAEMKALPDLTGLR